MKRILFEFPGLGGGRLFDPTARDNVSEPFVFLRERLHAVGYDLATADDTSVKDADSVWFWDVPTHRSGLRSSLLRPIGRAMGRRAPRDLLAEAMRHLPAEHLVLFLGEPPVTNGANWEPKRWEPFGTVFSWADALVDGSKFFKFVYALPNSHPDVPDPPFDDRRLLANISANKHSSHPAELYSARRSVIRYCESAIPRQFALFGPGWDAVSNTHPSYEGTPRHKWEVYPYFRFGLCYENMVGAAGYVTEKIFDCMRAGAVPVYLGAPNIADYVNQEVFIDRRQFRSDAELVSHLSSVDEVTFKRYREAARSYLAGPAFRRFLPESFADAILGPLGLEDAA